MGSGKAPEYRLAARLALRRRGRRTHHESAIAPIVRVGEQVALTGQAQTTDNPAASLVSWHPGRPILRRNDQSPPHQSAPSPPDAPSGLNDCKTPETIAPERCIATCKKASRVLVTHTTDSTPPVIHQI
jgi:hypothetical protein